MKMNITELRNMEPGIAAKLQAERIFDSEQLLEAAAHPKERAELAAKLGIESRLLLEFANRSDLARLNGVGRVYSDLLEHAGVDTVPELAQRNAANLHQKLVEVNAEKNLVQRLPRQEDVADWVAQAKGLSRIITY